MVASGGPGGAAAGKGGTITPEPGTGDVNVAGPMEIDLRGGDSLSAPGAGGLLNGGARTDPGNGSVHITGEIVASGGQAGIAAETGVKGEAGEVLGAKDGEIEVAAGDGAVTLKRVQMEGGIERPARA